MVLTIIFVFISFVGLIVIHEFGHFILAKKFGVKVEEFGIFLPPRLIGKKIGETLYSLNLLPLGAFVKLYGEEDNQKKEPFSFSQKPIWQRFLVVIGGAISFWIIAAIFLTIVMGLGAPVTISDEENGDLIDPKVQIVAVAPNSPAEISGIKPGDAIRKFKIGDWNFEIQKVKQLQELTEKYKGRKVTLTIERGKKIFEVSLVPRVAKPEGEGAMGVVLVRTAIKSYPWYLAPIKGIKATLNITMGIVRGLAEVLKKLIFSRGLPPGIQLLGPVGIGALMIHQVQLGINYYLNFMALISIYLAIFNLLPIPALDGGKLLFLAIEAVRKKSINQKIEQKITSLFFALLIILIILVTIKDLARLKLF